MENLVHAGVDKDSSGKKSMENQACLFRHTIADFFYHQVKPITHHQNLKTIVLIRVSGSAIRVFALPI